MLYLIQFLQQTVTLTLGKLPDILLLTLCTLSPFFSSSFFFYCYSPFILFALPTSSPLPFISTFPDFFLVSTGNISEKSIEKLKLLLRHRIALLLNGCPDMSEAQDSPADARLPWHVWGQAFESCYISLTVWMENSKFGLHCCGHQKVWPLEGQADLPEIRHSNSAIIIMWCGAWHC